MERVSDYIFRFITEHTGVQHVFMLPGGGCMHLVDSLGRQSGLEFVCNLHEQACAIAAEAYAQYNNELGVALVTAGPGSTNAITGVAGAWIDSTPLLVLSGQAKREDRMVGLGVRQMGIQEVDIASIVTPITKYAKCVMNPESIRMELEKALYHAQNGRRGPVWLDIPLDVQGAIIDPDRLVGFEPEPSPEPDYKLAARTILAELRRARRPAVYAGNGIRATGAVGKFMKLVEQLRIPVLTSWKAADFLPEEHPLFAGRPGIVAQRSANFAQQTADCLLILGTRLDLCQTGFNHPHFAPCARKLMVDIDVHEIDKLNMPLTGKFVMDAGKLIEAMLSEHPEPLDSDAFLERIQEWRRRYPVILPEYCDESKELVNLYHLIGELSRQLEDGDLLIPGSSGACAEVTLQAIKVKSGVRIQNTPGLGSMGFGLPALIGGCLATGRRRTVGIVGDGGLQHNIQELETLHRLNLPVKLFVLNNNGYGSIVNMQKSRFAGNLVACNPDSGLTLPSLERICAAYQLDFIRIQSPRELGMQIQTVLAHPGTVICEVMTDPDVMTSPRLASESLPDGRMVSKPMEELAPFLGAEELAENLRCE